MNNIPFVVSNTWMYGGNGGIDLANKIVSLLDCDYEFKMLYEDDMSIVDKIKKVCIDIYGANDIDISDRLLELISKYEKMGYSRLPICIAKTQYSLSDNPKLLGRPNNFNVQIRDVRLSAGAGFIVVIAGNIMTMPGLSKQAAYLNMYIDTDGNITGLF